MKWLIIQSDGEHKGQDGWEPNWMMRECYAIQYAFEQLGHQADTWGLRHANFANVPDFNSYDGIFSIENYEFEWLPHINACYRPAKVYWIIDAHCQPLNAYSDAIKGYDVVLHSTRGFIKPYQQLYPKHKHLYFPNGVDNRFFDQALYELQPHSIPIIFIGGKNPARAEAIDRMASECGLVYSYGITGMAYVKAVLDAKVQFNKGINGDINYRNWETIGLGTCLLTEHDPEMEKLGFNNINCLFYRTIEEAVALAKAYSRDDNWTSISQEGYKLSRQHTYIKRITDLLASI